MKSNSPKLLSTLLFLFFITASLFSFGQVTSGVGQVPVPTRAAPKGDALEVNEVDAMAAYPGGMRAMQEFIAKNLKFPKNETLEGREIIAFNINVDGNVGDIRFLRSLGAAYDMEVIRVFRMMPKWTPAELNGVPVKSVINQPITFTSKR